MKTIEELESDREYIMVRRDGDIYPEIVTGARALRFREGLPEYSHKEYDEKIKTVRFFENDEKNDEHIIEYSMKQMRVNLPKTDLKYFLQLLNISDHDDELKSYLKWFLRYVRAIHYDKIEQEATTYESGRIQ